LRIEPFTADRYDEVIRLWEEAELSHRPKGRDRRGEIEREIAQNPDLFLGAFEGGRLVGTVIGTWDGRRGMINRLAVHPDFRGRGYAKELVAACEEALRKRGAGIICALIDDYNTESLALFQRIGYTLRRDILYLSKRDPEDT
jgi:ribosomal protein S18 acetylase RimI-like enzyme